MKCLEAFTIRPTLIPSAHAEKNPTLNAKMPGLILLSSEEIAQFTGTPVILCIDKILKVSSMQTIRVGYIEWMPIITFI